MVATAQLANKMLDEKELVLVDDLTDDFLIRIGAPREALLKMIDILDIESEYLYYRPYAIDNPFCYWDGLFFHPILHPLVYISQEDNDEFVRIMIDIFVSRREISYKLYEEKKWEELLEFIEPIASIAVFENIRELIPIDLQKELFLTEYIRSEFGFNTINQKMLREILQLPNVENYDISTSSVEPDEDGFYTIYRGEDSMSTPYENAYSWTINKNIAKAFATRSGSPENGRIITGRVKKNDIKAYSDIRSEAEVIIFPEDVTITSIEKVDC